MVNIVSTLVIIFAIRVFPDLNWLGFETFQITGQWTIACQSAVIKTANQIYQFMSVKSLV